MKKTGQFLAATVLAGCFALSLVGCGPSSSKSSADGTSSSASSEKKDTTVDKNAPVLAEGKCADFKVVVNAAEFGTAKDGKPCITVTYTFTNDKPTISSFYSCVTEKLTQGDSTLVSTDAPNDNGGDYDEIQKGESIKVVKSFELEGDGPVKLELFQVGKTDPLTSYTFKK